jgi:hypothetical protein
MLLLSFITVSIFRLPRVPFISSAVAGPTPACLPHTPPACPAALACPAVPAFQMRPLPPAAAAVN